ncbi:MAG: cell division protein FtsB [Hymenobacter sp.]|nr:cell division protein FtsB [Hymenobacter sp.]
MTLFLTSRFFQVLAAIATGFVVAFFLPWLLGPMKIGLGLFVVLALLDALLLYAPAKGQTAPVFGRRVLGEKLANGSDNDVRIYLENRYRFAIQTETIDEIPHQFQRRDVLFTTAIKPGETQIIDYQLRPTKRGEYEFGALNIYATSLLGLVRRRFRYAQGKVVPVYPSFLQMRQYELLAIHNRLTEVGVKRIRRVGHSMEFEQIRPYVAGDDPRSMNWKATARRAGTGAHDALVVNHFQDERAQQVYCLIDKGRVMRMPFDGLSLLDYAINATLVVSNIALLKHDKAGLLTFSNRPGAALAADRRPGHLLKLLEILYRQKTKYLETDFELLYATVRAKIKQRSLLILFTNFETLHGMQRQLPYLRRLAKDHLLLVVFFENTELRAFLETPAATTEDVYNQTIAEKFAQEKRQIVLELQRYGIYSLLTAPKDLTANTINKYLEFKARGLI